MKMRSKEKCFQNTDSDILRKFNPFKLKYS